MARELRGVSNTSAAFARIRNRAGLWWNGTTFEAYNAADYANYVIALTQEGASGVFVGDFPAGITASGTYEYYVHAQQDVAPAETDPVAGTGVVDWTGAAAAVGGAGSMTGSDFYDYLLRKGFKRTDKETEVFEAVTDAVMEMRNRFAFDEAKADATTTATIAALGDYKIAAESDLGLLTGVILEKGQVASELNMLSKADFDRKYPDIAANPSGIGYPRDCCFYGGSLYIGPAPDSTSYLYRLTYSRAGGAVTALTAAVPFTSRYRAVLCDLVYAHLYDALEEYDKANLYRQKFEGGFALATRRERLNAGEGTFAMRAVDC